MATYKYAAYLAQIDHAAFDNISNPGAAAPFSGVYRCQGCGSEVASNQGQPLPLKITTSMRQLRAPFAGG